MNEKTTRRCHEYFFKVTLQLSHLNSQLFSYHKMSKYNFMFQARCPSPFGLIANRTDITWTPIRNNDISWNFSKWLIDHTGQPFRRYTSRTEPNLMREDIKNLIKACEEDNQSEQLFNGENSLKNSTVSTANSTTEKKLAAIFKSKRTLIQN